MTEAASRLHRTLFGSGVLLGLISEQVVLFAVPLLIFQNTKEVSSLGFAFALEWLPSLIAYPFAGLVADRDGGARLFSRVMGIRGAVLLIVLLVCATESSWTTGALMTGGAVLSIFVAPTRMSVEKMVPQLAKGDQVAPTQALVQNMELLAMALGPALAMLAAAVLGKLWLLAVAAGAFGLGAAAWLPLPRGPREVSESSARQNLADLAMGWRLLVGNRPVLLLGILNFSINLVFATLLSANAALVTGVFHAPDSAYGLLNTVVGIIGLLNLLLIPKLLRRFGVGMIGATGFVLLCCALLLAGVAPSYPVYACGFVAALIGDALYNIYNRTQRLKVIPQEHLGKIMGPFYLLNLLSMPIAGLVVGGAASTIGPQSLVTVLTVALCLFGAVFLPLTMRSFRQALTAREPEPAGVPA
ncbi:MFS transporter [Streptacidiphilus jiangxiensis]|uniref:Major Facilitator Superfamily protein n=1 Tax=Streptacidiphilus jiangxiensis TaxID=235985 RepID=A0A1H7VLU4_STRJI|nr:MFS transporter [Streptacidiphilus jiangxiensis]SEM09825.1 Major Facilitator Superfamily protein [Streptacidiphilus jiangxiensis]